MIHEEKSHIAQSFTSCHPANAKRLRRISRILNAQASAHPLRFSWDGHIRKGFTLIELSIVLVVIGLVVGGVLVGQDLVRSAGERATVTQSERFNQAANTFYGKYNYLPGDIPDPAASSFGFAARGHYQGEGDGNGILESNYTNSSGGACQLCQANGEHWMFWVDLSTAHLIDGGFSTASSTGGSGALVLARVPVYMPPAKIGRGNYFYVYTGLSNYTAGNPSNGTNYYGLSAVTGTDVLGDLASAPGLTVKEAADIDKKIDDGLPQSGAVTAQYNTVISSQQNTYWSGTAIASAPYTTATPGTSATCYDNGGVPGEVQQYSVEISGGANVNCALSFRFQ